VFGAVQVDFDERAGLEAVPLGGAGVSADDAAGAVDGDRRVPMSPMRAVFEDSEFSAIENTRRLRTSHFHDGEGLGDHTKGRL